MPGCASPPAHSPSAKLLAGEGLAAENLAIGSGGVKELARPSARSCQGWGLYRIVPGWGAISPEVQGAAWLETISAWRALAAGGRRKGGVFLWGEWDLHHWMFLAQGEKMGLVQG